MLSLSELQQTAEIELNATLIQSLDNLNHLRVVTSMKYIHKVLPLDGFVSWARASVLSGDPGNGPDTVSVKGYLHLATETIRDGEQLYDRSVVTFTAQADIDSLNDTGSDVLYIGEFLGTQFSLSRRTGLNKPAGLYHRTGEAIYPHMRSQIIDSADDIDLSDVVVSSSLLVWLGLGQFTPMFPTMLSTQNLSPPFMTIRCSNVSSIAGAFYADERDNQCQLVPEDMTILIIDPRNATIEDLLRCVQSYILRGNAEMGVMNILVVQNECVTQNELDVIAMHKTIKFRVSYYQQRMRNVARGLILSVIPSIHPGK